MGVADQTGPESLGDEERENHHHHPANEKVRFWDSPAPKFYQVLVQTFPFRWRDSALQATFRKSISRPGGFFRRMGSSVWATSVISGKLGTPGFMPGGVFTVCEYDAHLIATGDSIFGDKFPSVRKLSPIFHHTKTAWLFPRFHAFVGGFSPHSLIHTTQLSVVAFFCACGPQNHPKSPKIIRNHPKSSKIIQNHPKSSKIIQNHPKSSKIIQNHPKTSKIIQNHPKSSKVIQSHPKSSKITQNHPKSSKIIQSHPKSSKVIQNHPKSSETSKIIQNHPKSSKITQNHPKSAKSSKSSKIIQSHPKSSKIIQSHPKSAKIIQNHPKSSKITQNHPKSSRVIQNHLKSISAVFSQNRFSCLRTPNSIL